ncbi:hypothetical protein PQX77_013437 [Marasmius sp. AFHP31]|nr:hypothetical protein PQX77_013437 [Marasmius sp. AFHP31]
MGTAPHSLYLWSTVLLFVAGTVNVVLFTHDAVRGMSFMFTALQTGDDTAFFKFMTVDRLTVIDQSIDNILSVICKLNAGKDCDSTQFLTLAKETRLPKGAQAFPLTLYLPRLNGSSESVLGLTATIILTVPSSQWKLLTRGEEIAQVYNGSYAGANLLITTLTASRIWWLSRKARESNPDSGAHRLYVRIVAIILESGSLYPIVSFIDIGLSENASKIGVPIRLLPTVTLIAGIAPALMIVRCRVFNALQDRTVRGAGALSTLHFDSNVGVATNPAQTDSQARDIESQSELYYGAAENSMGDSNTHSKDKENAGLSGSPKAL